MLIEKELIEEAKQRLGKDNAHIMAGLLELDGFDERNLKACCPYHKENTASFIYNKKNYTYHCFGCNTTVDLIDVLMQKGSTFLEAVKYIFDKAGIEYSFGEQDVRTKRNYKYPKEVPLNGKKHVITYWGRRGISRRVIDYLDIREDEHGNGVFNFYDTNDVLTMVKYRPAKTIEKGGGQPKTWCQPGSDTASVLFNMNRVNTSKPLLICEGETDCASAIEAGYTNTVSVPLGAGNLHWIEENWDWLNTFDSILIWSDNDAAGTKMRRECIYRLGTWRTKYIETPQFIEREKGKRVPLKDINDCLQIGGREFVRKLIADAKDVPVKSVIDYSDIEELDISEMDGVVTGIKPLDQQLIKIFYGTLTILSGRPGSGKTSIIDQTIARTIDSGNSVFLFSKEMPERMSANWFNTIIAGRRNMTERTTKEGKKYYIVPGYVQKKMQSYYSKKLLIYKDDEPNDIDSVMRSAEECVRKYGAKLIVLDNLMMLDLKCSENDKNTAQTNLINTLIKFASKYNVAVVLIAHPRKTQDTNSDIEMYDISGSSNIINLAMRSIGLRRVSKKEKRDPKAKWGKYDVVLTVIKDRLLGKADFQMGLWYDLTSRRFYTDYEEYDARFAWDDKEYATSLPYVDRAQTAAENVFPDR
ncbi:MAG: CHC2 zinc finger domain-containing protein [Blautia sp.]